MSTVSIVALAVGGGALSVAVAYGAFLSRLKGKDREFFAGLMAVVWPLTIAIYCIVVWVIKPWLWVMSSVAEWSEKVFAPKEGL